MADPVLNLRELSNGNPRGYLDQNERNLVMARLAFDPRVTDDLLTTPPGSVGRSQMWILSGAGSGQWAGRAANDIAISLVATPASASGWFFFTPVEGTRVWILAGTNTGHRVWNGSAWAVL